MAKKVGIIFGESNKKFIKADLKKLGISKEEGSFLSINTDGASYKIKTNYTGERKKIHLTKEVYTLLVQLVAELEMNNS